MAKKEIPVMIKVLAVLEYIGVGFLTIFGILFIVFSASMAEILKSTEEFIQADFIGAWIFIVIGSVLLALAVLTFFIARGLWKGQNWARIIVIAFSVLGVFSGINFLIEGDLSSIISIIINGLIVWYMWTDKKVKKAFE